MKVVRLVKNSDFKSVEHLVKHSGKGMTTMPKTPKEIKERIAWSEKSRNKKTKKPNHDSYLFVLEDNGRIVGLSAIYTSVSLKKPSVFFKKSILKLESKSLNFTKDLDVLSLHLCKQPYSELGTLFLKPAFRGKGRGTLLLFQDLFLCLLIKSVLIQSYSLKSEDLKMLKTSPIFGIHLVKLFLILIFLRPMKLAT